MIKKIIFITEITPSVRMKKLIRCPKRYKLTQKNCQNIVKIKLQMSHQRLNMKFNINLPDGEYTLVKYYIDDNCNYFDEWCADRVTYNITDDCFGWSPDDPCIDTTTTLSAQWARELYFNNLKAAYANASVLTPVTQTITVTDGTLVLDESIALNTVVFIDILK